MQQASRQHNKPLIKGDLKLTSNLTSAPPFRSSRTSVSRFLGSIASCLRKGRQLAENSCRNRLISFPQQFAVQRLPPTIQVLDLQVSLCNRQLLSRCQSLTFKKLKLVSRPAMLLRWQNSKHTALIASYWGSRQPNHFDQSLSGGLQWQKPP